MSAVSSLLEIEELVRLAGDDRLECSTIIRCNRDECECDSPRQCLSSSIFYADVGGRITKRWRNSKIVVRIKVLWAPLLLGLGSTDIKILQPKLALFGSCDSLPQRHAVTTTRLQVLTWHDVSKRLPDRAVRVSVASSILNYTHTLQPKRHTILPSQVQESPHQARSLSGASTEHPPYLLP